MADPVLQRGAFCFGGIKSAAEDIKAAALLPTRSLRDFEASPLPNTLHFKQLKIRCKAESIPVQEVRQAKIDEFVTGL
jgi:hypothetical protein